VWTCGAIADNATDVCAIIRYSEKCDCGCLGTHSYEIIEEVRGVIHCVFHTTMGQHGV
jgi:hypothetical protein